jgi:hypothetical protein
LLFFYYLQKEKKDKIPVYPTHGCVEETMKKSEINVTGMILRMSAHVEKAVSKQPGVKQASSVC